MTWVAEELGICTRRVADDLIVTLPPAATMDGQLELFLIGTGYSRAGATVTRWYDAERRETVFTVRRPHGA